MNIDNIHPEIKKFVKDCSEQNFRTHQHGTVRVFAFKDPKVIIMFINSESTKQMICTVTYNGIKYSENEFVRLLKLKAFW